MATNDLKMSFAASATTVISNAATIADGDVVGNDTTLDNSTGLYPLATATLYCPDSWLTTAPTDGTTVDLYMVRQEVDSTNHDTDETTSTDPKNAEYVGSFLVTGAGTSGAFRKTIVVSLTGVQSANYYIQNNTAQTINYSATSITVKIHPFTWVPAT